MKRSDRVGDLREVLRLAAPLAFAQAGLQLMGSVDTAVVGRLGARELAATGLGSTIFFLFFIFAMGIVIGIDPMISQAVGAKEPDRARSILWQGVWLAGAVGLAMSIVMTLFTLVFDHLGIDPAVVALAVPYIVIRAVGVIPMLLFVVMRSYLQAYNITRPLIAAIVIGNVFNLAADVLLVFGGSVLPEWVPFREWVPALGVPGSAIATVMANLMMMIIMARGVARQHGHLENREKRAARDFHAAESRQAFRVGLPIGLQMGAEVGIFALVAVLAGRLGSADLAAHQVAIMLASFTFCFALGVGSAGSVVVGRAVGALDTQGARSAGLVAFGAGGAIMLISAISFALFPGFLVRLMSDDPEVIAATVPLLMVAAFFQVSDGVQAVGAGVLRGAGDTRFTFIANLVGHWLIGLPMAMYFGFRLGQGVVGLWWGLCFGLTVVAVLLVIRFLRVSSKPIVPLEEELA